MNDFSPQDLLRLRRGAYTFLRTTAARAWGHEHGGDRWDIVVPPEIEALPEHKRYRTHARREAERLANARLYDVCPQLTNRAVLLGAAIREHRYQDAAALTGLPNVMETRSIRLPATHGFLRWRDPDGIAHNERGVPIIACHWGPVQEGCWVVWWSDTAVLAEVYAADARDTGAPGTHVALMTRTIFGPLFYDQQELLLSVDRVEPGQDTQDRNVDVDPSLTALICTTWATWRLLADPAPPVTLTEHSPQAAEQTADRAAGLAPRPITVATAAGSAP